MSTFKFRLATLLRLRASARDQRRSDLAEAFHAEQVIREQRKSVAAKLAELLETCREAARPGAGPRPAAGRAALRGGAAEGGSRPGRKAGGDPLRDRSPPRSARRSRPFPPRPGAAPRETTASALRQGGEAGDPAPRRGGPALLCRGGGAMTAKVLGGAVHLLAPVWHNWRGRGRGVPGGLAGKPASAPRPGDPHGGARAGKT